MLFKHTNLPELAYGYCKLLKKEMQEFVILTELDTLTLHSTGIKPHKPLRQSE